MIRRLAFALLACIALAIGDGRLRSSAIQAAPDPTLVLWPLGDPDPNTSVRTLVVKLRRGVSPDQVAALLRLDEAAATAAANGKDKDKKPRSAFRKAPKEPRGHDPVRRARRQRRAPRGSSQPELDGTYVVELPPTLSAEAATVRLLRDPRVEYAQADHVHEVQALPGFFWESSGTWGQPYADQWSVKKLDVEPAWALTRGQDAIVAVIDSGIDPTHPDLTLIQREVFGIPGIDDDQNGYIDDFSGWNFVADNNDIQDRYGHGTHVAGLVAANPDNRNGLAGVAPHARLLAVKAVDDGGRTTSARLAAGIVYAVDNDADIVLTATACAARCPSDPVMEQAIRYATAAGVLVVTAAGNRGDDVQFYSPQNMLDPRPLVVGATDHFDRRESFSNFGELMDLSAPGGGTNVAPPSYEPVLNILSTKSRACASIVCTPPLVVAASDQVDYLRRAGTSSAAAHVTGVAALVLSHQPDLSLSAVRRRLLGNALDLGPAGCDPMFGCGRVTAYPSLVDTKPFIVARLVAPAAGATVNGNLAISGAAFARPFARYEVSVGAGPAPTTWITSGLTASGAATDHGQLAVWNTETAADGVWTIRLIVFDTAGARREVRRTVTVDNSRILRQLTVDVASDPSARGSVHALPPRAMCDGAAGVTRTCSYVHPSGTSVTLTALPDAGTVFAGWSGACAGTGSCTVAMTQSRSVRATFRPTPTFRLTLVLTPPHPTALVLMAVTPPGTYCRETPCTYRLPPGTTVSLRPGYATDTFMWDPGQPCTGVGSCTVVLDRDMTLRGTFPFN